MDDDPLAAYLIRTALDDEFRALALADPDAALGEYAITGEEALLLRTRDPRVLELIGRVVRRQQNIFAPDERDEAAMGGPDAADEPPTPADEPAPSPSIPGSRAAEVGLLLRVVPYAQGTAGIDLDLSYAASLQTVPAPALVDDVPLTPIAAPPPARPWQPVTTPADITIVGIGIAASEHLTRGAERALRAANEVLYLDTGVATPSLLGALCARVTSLFAESYVEDGARVSAYDHMVTRVLEAASDRAPVAFAVHGHPLVGMHAPVELMRRAGERGLSVAVIPGVSAMDCLFADLGVDPVVSGCQMYEATDLLLRRRVVHPDVPALIWQAGNVETRLYTSRPSRAARFERLRDHLIRFYPPDHRATIYFASPHPLVPSAMLDVSIATLPGHAADLHPSVTLYIPPAFDRPIVDNDLASLVDDPAHLARMTR